MIKYYKILEIPQTATKEEIKKAYRKLSKRYHPDMPEGNSEKYIQIKEAYDILAKGESVVQQAPPKYDLTPYVYIAGSQINSEGTCNIFMNVRNIQYVFIAELPLENYKWTINGSVDGRIEIFKGDLIKCKYSFNLVFMPYDGNLIIKTIKLKDPRGWVEKVGYKLKKFLEI